jgi:actin-related protein
MLSSGKRHTRSLSSCSDALMFPKKFVGIKEMILRAYDLLPQDLRRDIFTSIVISGGSTNLKTFNDRLQKDLSEESTGIIHNYKTKFYFCNGKVERRTSSWIGASIIASIGAFESLMMTRSEYLEHGYSLVERKFN